MPTRTAVAAIAFCPFYFGTNSISYGFLFGKNLRPRRAPLSLCHTNINTIIRPHRNHDQQSLPDPKTSNTRKFASNNDEDQDAHSVIDVAAVPVLGTATVDYSAANEYFRAHYNNQSQYYFDTDTVDGKANANDNGKGSTSVEQVHDGRILQSHYLNEREMLTENGLAIIESSMMTNTNKLEWDELEDIQSSYLPELERIIHKIFPSSSSSSPSTSTSTSNLMSYCFWNPMMRGETYEISRQEGNNGKNGVKKTPTANIASLVHIDTDVGAYENIQDFLDIVEKNRVVKQAVQSQQTTIKSEQPKNNTSQPLSFKEMSDAIINGRKRFAVINFWRNIGEAPVASAPLAILSTRYDDNINNHNHNHNRQQHQQQQKQHKSVEMFPNASPNMKESKWYIFPNATRDEVIVFYQYDRNSMQPSDLWHCAISTPNREQADTSHQTHHQQQLISLPPRRSFDIRALVVLDESVPEELDRFSYNRTRPVLTFEESGCFCDEQAAIRNKQID